MLDAPAKTRTVTLLLPLLLFAAALSLRLYDAGHKSLWYDEAVIWQIVISPDVVAANAEQNSAPPLFPLAVHAVSSLGDSEAILRLLSVLGGALAVPAVYLLARRFVSWPAAAFAALLLTLSSNQVLLSQQLREYSLTLLVATVMLVLFVRYVTAADLRALAVFTAVGVLGVGLQYGIPLLLVALNLTFVIAVLAPERGRGMRLLRPWIVSQVVIGLAALVVVLVSLRHQFATEGFGEEYLAAGYWRFGSLTSLARLTIVNTAKTVYFASSRELFIVLALLNALGLWLALDGFRERLGFATWARLPLERRLFLCLFVLPPAVTLFLALLRFYPYFGGRQDVFLLPMLYVSAALGFDVLLAAASPYLRTAAIATVAVVAVVGLWSSVDRVRGPGVEQIEPLIAYLHDNRPADEPLYVLYYSIPAFTYYTRSESLPNVIFGGPSVADLQPPPVCDCDVWLLFSHIGIPNEQLVLKAAFPWAVVDSQRASSDADLYHARVVDPARHQSEAAP